MFKKTEAGRFSIKLGGQAGWGVMTFADLVGKMAMRSGLWVFEYPEYPSLIRGGNNTQKVTLSSREVFSTPEGTDVLVALDRNTYNLYKGKLGKEGWLIGWQEEVPLGERTIVAPGKLKKQVDAQLQNSLFFAILISVLGFDEKIAKAVLEETFAGKKTLLAKNKKAFALGLDFSSSLSLKEKPVLSLPKKLPKKDRLLLSGNEAIALGAVSAGCDYAAIYPMTPISNILHLLEQWKDKTGTVVFQPEDEIAGVISAIGASFAGRRAMVATSGGGFCLMSEGLGMAGISETPLVLVEGQRTGPSTGMPTWTEQADLQFLISASHSEFPRIILAPGDPVEAFRLTRLAFWLAQKYQLPVIVITDKFLSESKRVVAGSGLKVDELTWPSLVKEKTKEYRRYRLTGDNISPRAVPGNVLAIGNSYEHRQDGYTTEEAGIRNEQMKKRLEKLANFDLRGVKKYGSDKARLTLVAWGSNKGPALEALAGLDNVNLLHFTQVYPLPKSTASLLKEAEKLVLLENNSTGQFGRLIRQETGMEIKNKFLKNDGRPFFMEEIIRFAGKVMGR